VNRLIAFALLIGLAGCDQEVSLELPGNTEWDRITVLADASERIVDWHVAEGDHVGAGDLLLQLDGSRQDAHIAEAKSRLDEAEAELAELIQGPRSETIARARAELESAEAAVLDAELEYDRIADLLARSLTSQSSADNALATRNQRRAAVAAARAVLEELVAGTRPEQIAQAQARVARIRAELEELRLTRERLDVRAPRGGRVDSLPFRPGDQPRTGDVVASLLVGDAPIARIFVPAAVRPDFEIGDVLEIAVEGVGQRFRGRVRHIRSEASFTPYYALTGDDASRLVYRAELVIEGAGAADLPAGLPLVATPLSPTTAGD
jgi:HlyD family secretion protein